MAMTPDDYYTLNQANAKANPIAPVRRPTMDEFRANNRRVYGWDGTFKDAERWAAADNKRQIWLKGVLPAAIFATGGAASGALMAGGAAGGAGAAGAGAGAGASAGAAAGSAGAGAAGAGAAGTAGGGMTFGNLLKLGELGVGLGTNIYNNRQNNRAMQNDATMRQNEFAQQMQLVQQQNALAEQRYQAEQAQRAQEFAMLQEDRQRRIAEENRVRALDEAREQRRAPYRQLSNDALLRMRDLLRLGGR